MTLKLPNHVAIIMDGNRRWAKEAGMSSSKGHYYGSKNLERLAKHIFSKGIKYLSVYALSIDNFKRAKAEIDYLMRLVHDAFNTYLKTTEHNYKIIFSGKRKGIPKSIIKEMEQVSEETKNNDGGTLNICFNYSGRQEIVDATKKICEEVIEGKLKVDKLSPEIFEKKLYQQLPPIDLMIRTGGEQRISDFLLWQNSYAEFYFTNVYFPDFNELEFDNALNEYNNRDRRFGGNNEKESN